MADDAIKVELSDCKLGKVWDKKATRDVPGLIDAALKKALKTGVDLVSKAPAEGFKLEPSVDFDLDEKKGELSGKINVAVAWGDGRLIGTESKKGGLKDVTQDNLDKKLSTLCTAYGKQMGDALPGVLEDEKKKAGKKK